MADLRDDDRAQLLLVTAFVLAASFVALALVLNSVIFTENLATRGEAAMGSDAVSYRNDMARGTGHLIEYVNGNRTGHSAQVDELKLSVEGARNRSAELYALDGTYVNTTLYSVERGTRIGQNQAGNFRNTTANGPVDEGWQLVDNAYSTRSFVVNITDSSTLSGTNPYTVVVNDSSDDWELEISGSASATTLNVVGGGNCNAGGDPTVSLTAGTFNGSECPALEYAESVSPPYEIWFKNGDNVEGTYTLVANSTTYDPDNYGGSAAEPFAVDAVYSATVHVKYESPSLVYETDVRAIPGESDD